MTALALRSTRFLSRRALIVLSVAGAIGAFFGMVREPTWQDVIGPARVLAGLVVYPADNPVFIQSTRTWTLLHQLPAVLLLAGLSERAVSVLISGVLGVGSFQALAMTMLAQDAVLYTVR